MKRHLCSGAPSCSIIRPMLTLICIIASASCANAQVTGASNGGNTFLHSFGWQTFENAVSGDNNSGISDATPDSNSTFDATPVGSNSNGFYLTGIIGAGASNLGRSGFGQTVNNGFLNGPTFGATGVPNGCLLYTSPSPRDATLSRMPSSA